MDDKNRFAVTLDVLEKEARVSQADQVELQPDKGLPQPVWPGLHPFAGGGGNADGDGD